MAPPLVRLLPLIAAAQEAEQKAAADREKKLHDLQAKVGGASHDHEELAKKYAPRYLSSSSKSLRRDSQPSYRHQSEREQLEREKKELEEGKAQLAADRAALNAEKKAFEEEKAKFQAEKKQFEEDKNNVRANLSPLCSLPPRLRCFGGSPGAPAVRRGRAGAGRAAQAA